MSDSFNAILTWLLALAFAGAGIFVLLGPHGRWNVPGRFRFAAGGMLILAAILLAGPVLRMVGAVLAALGLFAAIVTFLGRSAYGSAVLGILLLGALWARVLIGPL